MEEKERYEYFFGTNTIKDNKTNQFYGCAVDLLNQQDKRIKELEEDQALLTILISGIDNLMHDKDYRFKNDNGTWYSRQSCKDLTIEEVYQEIIDEINQLDSNFEILDKENSQLKQQLHELPKNIVEEIKIEMGSIEDILINCGNGKEDALSWFNKILQIILKKFGGENE